MGRRRTERASKSLTMPPSPSHSFSSSSSSDFEFTVSISPRKSSTALCPADELFYKGQLLPLSLSPRLSMVRTLLASSSTSSSSDTTTSASRDSTGSSNDSRSSFTSDLFLPGECDSSRPSSVAEDDDFRRLNNKDYKGHVEGQIKKTGKYFSFSRFSSVFRKDQQKDADKYCLHGSQNRFNDLSNDSNIQSLHRRMSTSAKELMRKYLKKVKPLREKLSQRQQQKVPERETTAMTTVLLRSELSLPSKTERSAKDVEISGKSRRREFSQSFSGNLRYPRRRSYVSSCPSSMRSSPSRNGVGGVSRGGGMYYGETRSSMDEFQSAIQGAIAHCKNSMNKGMMSNEI